MTAQRRAPAGGYSFSEKEEYREHIWRGFQQLLAPDTRSRHVLLMPSIEGTEIGVAIRHGFCQQRLHVVDDNPAIVATLKRRYPAINTYGVSAVQACKRIGKAGIRLSAANFDFTRCVSWSAMEECIEIAQAGCWSRKAYIAVTVLRGREAPSATAFVRAGGKDRLIKWLAQRTYGTRPLSPADAGRVLFAFSPFYSRGEHEPNHVRALRVGAYLSPAAHQTMLWAMCSILDLKSFQADLDSARKDPSNRARVKSVLRQGILFEAAMRNNEMFDSAMLQQCLAEAGSVSSA